MDLSFPRLHSVNADRARRWHRGFPNEENGWVGSDWSNAMAGEAGEACNVVKKLRRLDFGYAGKHGRGREDREGLLRKLAEELADTLIYADLLASFYGIDLGAAVVAKFNQVSDEEGFPERLP